MKFERLTDEGPKGCVATFAVGKTPQPLGVAFVRSTNPKANCRLERATYETTAGSASPIVSGHFLLLVLYIFLLNLDIPPVR